MKDPRRNIKVISIVFGALSTPNDVYVGGTNPTLPSCEVSISREAFLWHANENTRYFPTCLQAEYFSENVMFPYLSNVTDNIYILERITLSTCISNHKNSDLKFIFVLLQDINTLTRQGFRFAFVSMQFKTPKMTQF